LLSTDLTENLIGWIDRLPAAMDITWTPKLALKSVTVNFAIFSKTRQQHLKQKEKKTEKTNLISMTVRFTELLFAPALSRPLVTLGTLSNDDGDAKDNA